MKYSYQWIQKHIADPLPSPEALQTVIHTKAFEVESVEKKGDDTIFDIAVLPDRAHDCLSHYGMAREVAGLCGLTLKPYTAPALPAQPLDMTVEVQSDTCRRYIAIKIDGVKTAPSPTWLKDALESIGARSINNIVDATNYVLFDRGQPTHVFDTEKVDGGIVVRFAHEGEKITTLSKEEKTLTVNDLVIADYLGPLAIAGVKGGAVAEVGDTTTSVIVEVANFNPATVRKTSRKLGLLTDASKRFENDLSPEVAYEAACATAALIAELAGGTVVGVSDTYQAQQEIRTLTCTVSDIARILGSWVTADVVKRVFDAYGYMYTIEKDTVTLTVPSERLDITGAHDLADEIGRVVGYDSIAPLPLPFTPVPTPSEYDKVRAVKWWLSQNGFREVMNYSFCKKGEVYVAYGAKDKSALRATLSDGLKESYEKNRINAPLLALDAVRLFEVGTVFLKEKEEVHVATADKGVFEELELTAFIEKYQIDTTATLEEVCATGTFVPWSLYPFIARDIAVWVATPDMLETLDTIVGSFAQEHCVRPPYIFDRFEKDGRTSVAYRLVFQSAEKTLTEESVGKQFTLLTDRIKKASGFEIR